MASQGGLTRRRGVGGAAANGDEESSSRVTSPGPRSANSYTDRTPETAYESGENGHKIAYDPRDISENEERTKQPKLTLMEEILLLGLKDKQVSTWCCATRLGYSYLGPGLPIVLERQHIICPTRLHSHRVGFQREGQHAERLRKTAVSPI